MTIVFDFDGVIVRRSEFSKREAWKIVFDNDASKLSAVKRLSEKYSGGNGTRADILKDLFEEEVRHGDKRDFVRKYSEKFDEVVQSSIMTEGIISEDRKALENLAQNHKLFINTATPEDVISKTVERLNIKDLFVGVYGMPTGKVENLKRAALSSGVDVEDTIFIGDGDGDYSASIVVNCKFIGVSNDWNKWKIGHKPFTLIESIWEIERLF